MTRLDPEVYQVGLQRRARAEYASGKGAHATGVIVAHIDVPSYVIVSQNGRSVPWRCDLTDVGELVTNEEYFRHANARRLRDGRNSVRPEFKRELPELRTGMSLASVVDAVIAAGHDLNEVSFGSLDAPGAR